MIGPTNATAVYAQIDPSIATNVGSATQPVFVSNSTIVPANTMVDTSTAQTVNGAKTFTVQTVFSKDDDQVKLINPNLTVGTLPTGSSISTLLFADKNGSYVGFVSHRMQSSGRGQGRILAYNYDKSASAEFALNCDADATKYVTIPNRAYNASNTADAVNIALLDAYPSMVRTTGNQPINGTKTLTVGVGIATILSADAQAYTWYKVAKVKPSVYARITVNLSLPYNNRNYLVMDAMIIVPRAANPGEMSVAIMSRVRNVLLDQEYMGLAFDGTDYYLYLRTGVNVHNTMYATELTRAGALINANTEIIPITPVIEDPTTKTNYVIV